MNIPKLNSVDFLTSQLSAFEFSWWVKYDLDYIKNWSFWLDIQIIIRTIGTLFQNNQL